VSVKFSLVYPTRHRPNFIKYALYFLERQKYKNFEVIVCDNYLDSSYSCEKECAESNIENIKYVRPTKPIGMVENWNLALQYATGDYICYFTDKMFLLPNTLQFASDCLSETPADIITWVYESYTPETYPDYFGAGKYTVDNMIESKRKKYARYDPFEELSKKGKADVARNEQDKAQYARGKICFGAYDAKLCEEIVKKTGKLFHNISPDYTSMILGLSFSKSVIEIACPGIVHVNTDLSNGGKIQVDDSAAFEFLSELENFDSVKSNLLVPDLYSSVNNLVAHDYSSLKRKFDLKFTFDSVNWLVYIAGDINSENRIWSSKDVGVSQIKLLENYIKDLSKKDKKRYLNKLNARLKQNGRIRYDKSPIKNLFKTILAKKFARSLLPRSLRQWRKEVLFSVSDIQQKNLQLESIEEILKYEP